MNYPAAELRGIQNNLLPLDGTPSRRELHPGGGRIKVGVKILSVFPLTLTLSLQGRGNYMDVISFDRLRTGIPVHILRQAQDRERGILTYFHKKGGKSEVRSED